MTTETTNTNSFNSRFSRLLTLIDLKTNEFADRMGCDRTYISRIRSGNRKLKRGSKASEKFILGLYDAAAEKGKLHLIAQAIGTDNTDELAIKLNSWLFAGEVVTIDANKNIFARSSNNTLFSERFSYLLSVTGISNIKLARAVHVDSSLVSRWKKSDSPRDERIRSNIIYFIINYCRVQGMENTLKELTGNEQSIDSYDFDSLYEWLFGGDSSQKYIKSMLTSLNSPVEPSVFDNFPIDEEKVTMSNSSFYGREGLQRSVLLFLKNAIQNKDKELLLYSDQSMEWLSGNKEFTRQWFSLMYKCLVNGTIIKIIHNVDRPINEMIEAIQSWLPLYLTGNITSFYSKKANGERFKHTFFISDSAVISCVTASLVDDALYRLTVTSDYLKHCRTLFRALLTGSKTLVDVTDLQSDIQLKNRPHGSELLLPNKQIPKLTVMKDEKTKLCPFDKCAVILGDSWVKIIRTDAPNLVFTFSHMSMVNAFRAYMHTLK